TVFLSFYPEHYRTLFALTIVPGAVAVTLIFFVPEPVGAARRPPLTAARLPLHNQPERLVREGALPREFTVFMIVLSIFTLGNSTDAFLLLRLTDTAGSARFVPLMWAALHVVKATTSVIGGGWSDRIGRRAVIGLGWLVYAAVYAGFAVTTTLAGLIAWFLIYGFYF